MIYSLRYVLCITVSSVFVVYTFQASRVNEWRVCPCPLPLSLLEAACLPPMLAVAVARNGKHVARTPAKVVDFSSFARIMNCLS